MTEVISEQRQVKWHRKMLTGDDIRPSGYEINGIEGINRLISEAGDNSELVSKFLTEFVFRSYPSIPDYAPSLSERFRSALKVMETYPDGSNVFTNIINTYFAQKEQELKAGYMLTPSSSHFGYESPTKRFTTFDRVNVTNRIAERALCWNRFAQTMVRNGEVKKLFTEHPYTHSIRPADGTKLPVGNLVVEIVPGAQRLRLSAHIQQNLQERWELREPSAQWFVMTHIMEKDMLRMASSIGDNMIDGMHLTPEVYAKSYAEILKLIDLNSHLDIAGTLSDSSWIYSAELKEHFPDQPISSLHDIAGDVAELGAAEEIGMPEQVGFATHDKLRRQAYEEGRYKVGVASRFIDKAGMEAVVRKYNPSA